MSTDCCDYGCDGKGINCPARISQAQGRDMEAQPWAFPDDASPQVEAVSDAWHFIGFVLLVGVLWAAVSLVSHLIN